MFYLELFEIGRAWNLHSDAAIHYWILDRPKLNKTIAGKVRVFQFSDAGFVAGK